MGTPRVGEIYLPILHPSDMCSQRKSTTRRKKNVHTQKLRRETNSEKHGSVAECEW